MFVSPEWQSAGVSVYRESLSVQHGSVAGLRTVVWLFSVGRTLGHHFTSQSTAQFSPLSPPATRLQIETGGHADLVQDFLCQQTILTGVKETSGQHLHCLDLLC